MQDTPAVKSTNEAVLRVPEGFTAVMSAKHLSRAGGEETASSSLRGKSGDTVVDCHD